MGADRPINLLTYGHRKNRDEPEIPANKNKLAVEIFDRIIENMFRRSFTSVRVKNKQLYYLRDTDYANLLYGYHGCWWDGVLANLVFRKLYNSDFYMMIKDLYRFPFLSKIGGFSIEKDSVYGKLKAINYAVKLLEDTKNSVWIFPQGKLFPQDSRPIKFESGIAHICSKVKGVNLIPVAYKYTFLQTSRPEIFVEIGKPVIIQGSIPDKKELLRKLEDDFTKLLDKQLDDIENKRFKHYKTLLYRDFCWLNFIENNFKPVIRKRF